VIGPLPTPQVVVAIATYRRPGQLQDLVTALARQTHPANDFEVVIADDGSGDSTPRVVQEIAATAPIRVRGLFFDDNQGPGRCRNAAWRSSVAQIVAFTDDDCLPRPEWLEQLVAGITSGEGEIVQGRTVPRPDQMHRAGPWSRTVRVERATGHFQACNIAYTRATLEAVDGFDEAWGTGAGEDLDLALRAMATGAVPCFREEAVVEHEITESSYLAYLRDRRRWRTLVRLVRRHPETRALYWRPYVWRRTHARTAVVATALVAAGTLRNWLPAVLIAMATGAYLIRSRGRDQPFTERLAWPVLRLVADGYELLIFVAASIRQRTLLL